MPHPRFCELATDPKYAKAIVTKCINDKKTSDDPPKPPNGVFLDHNKFNYIDRRINIGVVLRENNEDGVKLARRFLGIRDGRARVGGVGIVDYDGKTPNVPFSVISGDSLLDEIGRADYILCEPNTESLLKDYHHKVILINESKGAAKYYFPLDETNIKNLVKYIYKIHYTKDAPVDQVGLIRKALNFGRAMFKHLTSGDPPIQEEIYAKRLSICYGCDFLNITDHSCMECGCPVSKKAKIPSQSCPLKPPLWEAYEMPPDPEPKQAGCGCGAKK